MPERFESHAGAPWPRHLLRQALPAASGRAQKNPRGAGLIACDPRRLPRMLDWCGGGHLQDRISHCFETL